jgi:hypothetical protein
MNKTEFLAVSAAFVGLVMSAGVSAQPAQRSAPATNFRNTGYIPDTFMPPEDFATSREHYDYLLDMYDGGVTHTHESVPKWDGIWSGARNNGAHNLFLDEDEIIPDVLTPEYEDAFRYRRDLGVDYDRLTTCEPAGMPRWLMEPYTREFVNTPTQSWWLNDLGNDTRRIFINQEHQNIDGTHYANGDSIGFWAEDEELGEIMVVHTIDVYPGDWFRGTPPSSNAFETTEVWYQYRDPQEDETRIAVNVTFYDELALLRPISATYTFRRRPDLADAGFRIRHWECDSNDNTFLTFDADGNPSTQYALPGEAGFVDPRGVDRRRNPDLPEGLTGQEKNPIFDDGLPVFDFGE